MPTLVVWEVKTVPDLQVFAAANGLTTPRDEEIRDAMGADASIPIIGQSYVSAGLSPVLMLINGSSI